MAREPVPLTKKFGYSYPLKGRSDAFFIFGATQRIFETTQYAPENILV